MYCNIGQDVKMQYLCSCLVFMVTLLFCIPSTSPSIGDRSHDFLFCLHNCERSCNHDKGYPKDLPWYLRLFFWDCQDECKYICMHKVTAVDVSHNRKVKQFYGKWPFVRCLGIQEPASSLFSFLNGLAHIAGWKNFVKVVPPEYRLYNLWKTNMLVNVNAWMWSTIFHARDLNWTEKMDYFCATSFVLFSIFSFFVRTLSVNIPSQTIFSLGEALSLVACIIARYPSAKNVPCDHFKPMILIVGPGKKCMCGMFGATLFFMFSYHVYYLGFVKFDYSYNIKANVAVGVMNMLGWLTWSLKNYKKQRYVWKCAFVTVSVFFLVGLEIFDFPPIWWTFDAHSLWHLGTIPFCYFWYSFLIDDARYELQEDIKGKQE